MALLFQIFHAGGKKTIRTVYLEPSEATGEVVFVVLLFFERVLSNHAPRFLIEDRQEGSQSHR